jgi:polyhydroxyalkanoate synthesis regulator phasin
MVEDIIKKAFYTGIGFLTNPKGFKEKIDDLVNEGDMTAEEGKKAFAEFEKDFKTKANEMEETIQGMIRNALDKMDVPSAEKVAAMEKQFENLEKEAIAAEKIEKLEKRIKSLELKLGRLNKEVKELKETEVPAPKKASTAKKASTTKKASTAKKTTTPKKTTTRKKTSTK